MMKNSHPRRIASTLLAVIALSASMAVPAYAGQGYRGTAPFGCQAYINGRSAWTDCTPAKASGYIHTKAWCTAEPTQESSKAWVSKGSRVLQIAQVWCTFNVHTAQTYWN